MAIGSRNIPWWTLYIVLAVVAFGARLLHVVHGGGLSGVGSYDDGVYFSAADAFIHGRLPYRDFLFIQPPGIVLAAAPFAWLGTMTSDMTGFIAGRVAFLVVGAFSTVLVAAILRRFGFVTAALGGFFYAVSYTAVNDERSILLEPLGTVGILVGLYVLSRPNLRSRTGWLVTGGIAAGTATGFKIWYLVPVLIIVAFAGRGWWKMLLGAIGGAFAVYLPFFAPAPVTSFQEIVLDQLGRGGGGIGLTERVHIILGDYPLPHALSALGMSMSMLIVVMVVIAVAGSAVALTVPGARLYVVLFAVDSVILLTAPSFFLHYASLTTPMLALVFGVAMGKIIGLVRWRTVQVGLAGVVAVLLLAGNTSNVLKNAGYAAPTAALQAAADRVDGCVIADDPTYLIVADTLTRDLDQGCPLWPDVSGYTYGPDRQILANGEGIPRAQNVRWQQTATRYLTSGAAVILARHATGLSAKSRRSVTSGELLYKQPGLIFVRTTHPAA